MTDDITKRWIRNESDERAAFAGYRFDLERACWTVWWIASLGLDLVWATCYGVLAASLIAGAWWWMRAAAPTRPFLAALAVPVHAFVQVALTSALGRVAGSAGASVDVLPGVALLGITVAFAAALVVLLPSREHFPRLGIPAPRWLRGLGRVFGRRR